MRMFFSLLAASLALPVFASETFVPGPDNKMVAKDILTVSIPWIKDKGGKYDLNMTMSDDNNDKGIIVFLSDINCQRGQMTGSLKYTFFNTGERTIDFRPKQSKNFNMVCNVPKKTKGEFKLTISKVYDNPSLDGKTVGKVIAKDLVWTQNDRKE